MTVTVSPRFLASRALGKHTQVAHADAAKVKDGEEVAQLGILGIPAHDAHLPAHGTRVFNLARECPAMMGVAIEAGPAALSVGTPAATFGPACEQGVCQAPFLGCFGHARLVDWLAAAHAQHLLLAASGTRILPVVSTVEPAAAVVILLLASVLADVACVAEPFEKALAEIGLGCQLPVANLAYVAVVQNLVLFS